MINERIIGTGAGADTVVPSEYFNTVLYTGNGGTQRVGGYINRGFISKSQTAGVEIPNVENLFQKKDTEHSVSLWFNGAPNAYAGEIFSDYATQSFTVFLNVNPSGYLQGSVRMNSSEVYITSSTTVNDGEWHNVVYTYKNSTSTINMYLDGSLVGSNTIPSSSYYSSSGTNIKITAGSVYYPPSSAYSHGINGVIDQLRIFNREVTSSEVTTLYEETHASTTISTTDIFSDGSGVALYQFDGNANDTGGVNGKFGAAAIFNGTTSNISIPTLGGSFYDSNFSISMWVNMNSLGAVATGYLFSGAGSRDIFMNFNTGDSGGGISARLYDGAIRDVVYSSAVAGQWYHVVFVRDKTYGLNLYVDGVSRDTNSYTGNAQALSFTSDGIGGRVQDRNTTDGKIDQVRIYNTALSSGDVTSLYNESNVPTSGLLAHYKLDGNALDSANSFDGTESNITYGFDGTGSVSYQEATNFSPDLVWIKNRDTSGKWHSLTDSVRGAGKRIFPNDANAELTDTYDVQSFDSNGFTIGNGDFVNRNNESHVAWCFNAGTEAAASNTDGTITSTVKANTDAGFSIVKYTGNDVNGQSIGHGLNASPELIIIKCLNVAEDWMVYTLPTGNDQKLYLNSSAAQAATGNMNNQTPTDDVFFVGGGTETGDLNDNYIAYCWHSVAGYSKIGSYAGTGGSVNVETGFEPAWIMIKRTDAAEDWKIIDNKRNNFADALEPNEAIAEENNNNSNFIPTSNGFQMNDTSGDYNANGGTYIYLAIAADPDTTTPVVENSFDVVTYTGNGGTQSIDTAMKPDLVWIAKRNIANYSHPLFDSVRGLSQPQAVYSDRTLAESNDGMVSFDTNGFSINNAGNINRNNDTFVAWCWKAGDHDDNLPQINTEGTTDSIVSVNDASGFSIVKYTAGGTATVGHGLSSAPELIITKNLDISEQWFVYAEPVGTQKFLGLNTAINPTSNSGVYTDVNATTFTNNISGTSRTYINYCFTSITGYQKIGSYTGAGSSGKTITTGFQPRFIIIKRTNDPNNSSSWGIWDNARGGTKVLRTNTSGAETSASTTELSFTSTGISIPTSSTSGLLNESGGTYIYLAIK